MKHKYYNTIRISTYKKSTKKVMKMARKQVYFPIEKNIQKIGDSAGLILDKVITTHLGVEPGDEIIISLEEGRYGKFIAVWKPSSRDIREKLRTSEKGDL